MDDQDTIPKTIGDSCSAVVHVFQHCMQKLTSNESYRLINIEYDRLRIWAGNIGVYGLPPASADDRLADDTELRDIVVGLLSELATRLQRRVDLGNDENLAEQSIASDSTLSSCDRDQKPSSRDNIDTHLLRHIRRITSQLFSILALVRRPTNLSSNEKIFGYDFQSKLRHEFESLIVDFEKYVDFYLRRTFKSEPPNGQCTLPEKLFVRLKDAAVVRRKALLLKARHGRKLRGNVTSKFARLPAGAEIVSVREPVSIKLQDSSNTTAAPKSEATRTILSGTVPSVAAQPLKYEEATSNVQAPPKSSKSVVQLRGKLDVPRPPKLEQPWLEVDCYVCGLTVDQSLLQEDRWKKHVLEDIDPFVCLFECNKPDVLYKLPDEWYKHMQTHRMEWCCMTPAHRDLIFDSEHDLETHLMRAHASKLSRAQIDLLLRRGRRPLPRLFEECPLCGKTVTELDPVAKDHEAAIKALHRHVEAHMYELALLSIPPHPDLVAKSESEAVNEDSDDSAVSLKGHGLVEFGPKISTRDIERSKQHDLTFLDPSEARPLSQVPPTSSIPTSDQTQQQIEYAQSQKAPTDLKNPDSWIDTCEEILSNKAQNDSEWKFRSEFHSHLAERDKCHDEAQLTFSIAEDLCTNAQIYRAVTEEAIDLVSFTILPSATNIQRTVTLFFTTLEAAAKNLNALDDLSINGIKIFVRQAYAGPFHIVNPSLTDHRPSFPIEIYQVGWICAFQTNMMVACAMLDEEHSNELSKNAKDSNIYRLGRLNNHNVVIACLPAGYHRTRSAAAVAKDMLRTFKNIRIGLTLGFGSGVPDMEKGRDIRLGDVVVGVPTGTHAGIIEFDARLLTEFPRVFKPKGKQKEFSQSIRNALSRLQLQQKRKGIELSAILSELQEREPQLADLCKYPGSDRDRLYCHHIGGPQDTTTCAQCQGGIIYRAPRSHTGPMVHFGTIASGKYIVRDTGLRDRMGKETDAICLEMEAVGLTDEIPFLIIRGISDYADASKSTTTWHAYAAAAAAAFTKKLLQTAGPITAPSASYTGLDDPYVEVIDNIRSHGHLPAALKVLPWLCYSHYPLRLSELADAFAMGSKDNRECGSTPEDRLRSLQETIFVCSTLVTCYTTGHDLSIEDLPAHDLTGRITPESSAKIRVRFLQDSLKEYLLSDRCVLGSDLQTTKCHAFIAESCLQYLQNISREPVLTAEILQTYPLASYAAEFWWKHAQAMAEDSLPLTTDMIYNFLTDKASLLTWTRLYDVDRFGRGGHSLSYNIKDLASPLYYAASIGSVEVTERIVKQMGHVNTREGYYGNILQAASIHGHEKVVQILLKAGADINARGGRYSNALQAASTCGHEKVVEVLLSAGAYIEAQDHLGRTALAFASEGGHEKVVEVLLRAGANIEARDDDGIAALSAALDRGHEKVVEVLLRSGADIEARDRFGTTALSAASELGQEKVVEMLLLAGADVNAQNYSGTTALGWASEAGQGKIVKILLRAGADIEARDGSGSTALQIASENGRVQVVQVLLASGADVNARGDKYGHALQAAAIAGHENILKILIETGANVNAQGGYHGNAIQAASWQGYESVVQTLLNAGADVNARGGQYGCALQAAIYCGKKRVVEILLQAGADVNAQDNLGSNALDNALSLDRTEIIQLLLRWRAKSSLSSVDRDKNQ